MASAENEIKQAIEKVKQQNFTAGEMMLNAVLRRTDVSNEHRAIVYLWMAQTRPDINHKIQCLSRAQEYDPQNPTIRQHLNHWLTQQSSRAPYPTQRPTPPQQSTQSTQTVNPMFPDSMQINLPSADLSDSQEVRTIGNDGRRTTGSAHVQDDEQRSQIFNRISPPNRTGDTGLLPRFDGQDQWTTGTIPGVTPPQAQPPYNAPHPEPRQQQPPYNQGQGQQNQYYNQPDPRQGQGQQPQPPYNQGQGQQDQYYNQPDPRQGQQQQQPPYNQGQGQQDQYYNQPNQGQPPYEKRKNSDSQPIDPFNQAPQQRTTTPHKLTQMSRVVGIKHGPNGNGSGVFVTRDGLIATTRNVVGGSQQVMVEIDTNYETTGQIVRSFPDLDLALVHVNVELERVWPPTNVPVIMDGDSFVSISYGQNVIRGNHRKSKGHYKPHWITTTVRLDHIKDAGGDAMYDGNNYLLGILTRNASRETGYVYGLHILTIYEKVNEFLRERQQMPNAGYCNHCGHLSRAQLYGGYYCETCGALRPDMDKIDRVNRTSPQLTQIYNENLSRTCPRCHARAGYHNSKCLRCSYDLEGRK